MMNQILNTINERSSYRGLYKNIPVPKEDLIIIMEAGLSAPSGCNNKQTTSLIVVDDFKLLEKMKQVIKPPICETAPVFICVLTQRICAYRNISFPLRKSVG
jgi:nitroreductase